MDNLFLRRRTLFSNVAKEQEDPSSTDGWLFGYRFNTAGQIAQEGCCITGKYAVNGGDTIQTCVPEHGPANIGIWSFTSEDDLNGSYLAWINRGDRNGRITIPDGVVYVQFSLVVSCLSTTFLYNMTSQKYIYKGTDVE